MAESQTQCTHGLEAVRARPTDLSVAGISQQINSKKLKELMGASKFTVSPEQLPVSMPLIIFPSDPKDTLLGHFEKAKVFEIV